jgi:hypothetical protein
MLHLFAEGSPNDFPLPYAEAVSRLASVRQALRLVSPFSSGPASDDQDDDDIAAAWDGVADSKRQLFDRRSQQMVGAASAGVEALLIEREEGREPHWAANDALIEEIRRELREVAGIIAGPSPVQLR